jgi:hypothetical protein
MARTRYTTEQVIGHLREAEVRLGQGQTVGTICRGLGITEQTYYRRRREYGGLKLDQALHRRLAALHDHGGDDVTDTLHLALQASGLDQTEVDCRPRLLSGNGPSYVANDLVANDLSDWREEQGMRHTRGKPYHPMT